MTLTAPADHPAAQTAAAAAPAAEKIAVAAPARELRLDLFRGLALWLIYVDHLSPDLLSWFTIRSYGFSDAAEIFIFISGYTAAMVYGRMMGDAGALVASARILRRVWQIYLAHIFLFTVLVTEIYFLASRVDSTFYAEEMGVVEFFKQPGEALVQAMLLRFRPLNMDVLPLYIVLMAFLPLVLMLMRVSATLVLVLSAILYMAEKWFDLHLTAYPNGFWSFNPFAWQLLFVLGVWCSRAGGPLLARLLASRLVLGLAIGYVVAAFGLTLTWDFPQLEHLLPPLVERLIYPIDKPDLDILRLLHFIALAVIAVRLVPKDWPGLQSRWAYPLILCGRHSLEIFCLGVLLAFAGYFVLAELHGSLPMHFALAFLGFAIMTGVAWLYSWHKYAKTPKRAAR